MTPHYTDDRVTLYHGDCIEVMRTLPDASVDSIVTDPPYELGFMGKGWDGSGIAYNCEVWENAYRVLKPGGHLLAFGGTRTWHRLAAAIEDAGFEVRDSIAWMYGSGFPKSHDVSKGIDKRAGAERERVPYTGGIASGSGNYGGGGEVHAGTKVGAKPETPAAQQWQGFGTALKPAFEPIVVARKPLIGTVAANVLTHGTGALNIDGCRIPGQIEGDLSRFKGNATLGGTSDGYDRPWKNDPEAVARREERAAVAIEKANTLGRWPANVILDESQAAALDKQSGVSISAQSQLVKPLQRQDNNIFGKGLGSIDPSNTHGDSGGASRFFYVAKANSSERPNVNGVAHPTVKPMALMQYLVRLVTPPGGTVLEPFAGSGTTIEAALNEGFNVIGIEMTDEYLPLIIERIERHGEKLW